MPHLFVFGLGYTGLRFARVAQLSGWHVAGSVTSEEKAQALRDLGLSVSVYDGTQSHPAESRKAECILSTIPASDHDGHVDPVLRQGLPKALWIGYLSSTGVYGDTDGAWVDETAAADRGTIEARGIADAAWRAQNAHIFRLPGIYGPGRSTLERAETEKLSRISKPSHVFSRIHVDDIVRTLFASIAAPNPGAIYNVADDMPAPSHEVEDFACDLLGLERPPLVDFEDAQISDRARRFYAQCRRVKNDKIKSELGITLLHPTYKDGLRACLAARHSAP